MQLDEKLPDENPVRACPKCGVRLPIWTLFLDGQEKRLRVGHNFCPSVDDSGEIVQICIQCKMTQRPRQSNSIFGPRKKGGSG